MPLECSVQGFERHFQQFGCPDCPGKSLVSIGCVWLDTAHVKLDGAGGGADVGVGDGTEGNLRATWHRKVGGVNLRDHGKAGTDCEGRGR